MFLMESVALRLQKEKLFALGDVEPYALKS